MSREEILNKIEQIVKQYTGQDTVTENMDITMDLGVNSFDLVNIIVQIEDEFDLVVSERFMQEFVKVSDIITYIEGAKK